MSTAQYAVRGALVLRAMQHEESLKRGEKRPFSKIYYCNIGNPQQLGQKPVSFFRQVTSIHTLAWHARPCHRDLIFRVACRFLHSWTIPTSSQALDLQVTCFFVQYAYLGIFVRIAHSHTLAPLCILWGIPRADIRVLAAFPPDVVERARLIHSLVPG